jgi:hypothetical protein
VVDDVIQDHKPPKREEVVEAMALSMVQRGQCPGMHIKNRSPIPQGAQAQRRPHSRPPLEYIVQTFDQAPSQQEGPAPAPGADGAPDDLFTLGDEECGTAPRSDRCSAAIIVPRPVSARTVQSG